jgi:hypothetical protein
MWSGCFAATSHDGHNPVRDLDRGDRGSDSASWSKTGAIDGFRSYRQPQSFEYKERNHPGARNKLTPPRVDPSALRPAAQPVRPVMSSPVCRETASKPGQLQAKQAKACLHLGCQWRFKREPLWRPR